MPHLGIGMPETLKLAHFAQQQAQSLLCDIPNPIAHTQRLMGLWVCVIALAARGPRMYMAHEPENSGDFTKGVRTLVKALCTDA